MDITTALEEFQAFADPKKAAEVAKYHKVDRVYLGVPNPDIDILVKNWRASLDVQGRVDLAAQLWDTNIHEPRVAASKLLVQQRMRPDDTAWSEIQRWVPEFDAWAIADHACSAGSRRLIADPSRIDDVEAWTTDENMWVRRAALVITLPWTKQNNPKPADLATRERILGWAGTYATDQKWFIQKAIGWWLRSLSKHDPSRVLQFIDEHGEDMKNFARKEAVRNM